MHNNKLLPPTSEDELMHRANAIAGLFLEDIASQFSVNLPVNLIKAKGLIGQLIERCLGADAGSLPIPDFYQLGIELKTIPIDSQGKPLESTYVCTTPLIAKSGLSWENSEVKLKLSRVLWVPIEAEKDIPIAKRRVGTPLLWSPTMAQENGLRADWEELTEMVCLGQLEKITAKLGNYLQIRPKALHSKSLCYGINESGEKILTLPRGFYLRSSFTTQILRQSYL